MPTQYARQKLLGHIKKWEKMRPKPYLDVDGNYAIGYGSHFVGGKPVTKDTRAIDEATATAELVAYLTERENTLAKFIPNWGRIPSDRQDMLLDVAMGKRGILSAETSSNLHRRLGATTDPAELSRIVDEEYPTYAKAGGEPSEGLANRRADGLNTLRAQQDARGGETRADAEEGDVGPVPGETEVPEPVPAQPSGPRIVINPSTFRNKKDALCVAFNEGFRILMEETGFNPAAEPTDAQRRFFDDTAYAGDENQLRRTILARICTFDTSVSNNPPGGGESTEATQEQLGEAAEFLDSVVNSDAAQTDWERSVVEKILAEVQSMVNGTEEQVQTPEQRPEPAEEAPGEDMSSPPTETSAAPSDRQTPEEGSELPSEEPLPEEPLPEEPLPEEPLPEEPV